MPTKVDVQKFIDSLEQQYKPRADAAVRRAVIRFAAFVLSEAQRITPVETGALVASAYQEDPLGVGADLTVQLGFNTNYAAYVHEILTNHHPQGQAKFLETAMRANAPKLIPYVLEELKKEFG